MRCGAGLGCIGVELVDQLLDAILAGDRLVVDEPQFGDAAQAQARSDLTAEKRGGALQRALRAAARLRLVTARSERCEVDARLLQIRGDLDARQGHEPDARIVHLAREQAGELAANLIRDAIRSRAL